MDVLTYAVQTALATAADGIQGMLAAVLPIALPIACAVLAVFLGWKVFKRFIR